MNEHNAMASEAFLDDITFIQEIKQEQVGTRRQYSMLLAARGYGWAYMLNWADYMAQADLEPVSRVATGLLGEREIDVTESYLKSGGKCTQTPALATEMGMLSMAGMSKALGAPVQINWVNQTRVLIFLTEIEDEGLMRKYAETVIRRSFGTEDAMKLAKPLPEEA